jgi:hypothetical protein
MKPKKDKDVWEMANDAARQMAIETRNSIGIIYKEDELDFYRWGWVAGYQAKEKEVKHD